MTMGGIAAFISSETHLIGWYSRWKRMSYSTVPDGTMDNYYLEPDGHPFINGCFNWMIPNLHMKNDCFAISIHFKLVF